MKLKDIIEEYISGDWGNEDFSPETPCAVYCVRGADIVPISNDQFNDIPLRYISKRAKGNKTLRAGDLVIEKSGGSPVQSTGRITYISQELIDSKQSVVCSNFCTSIRIKDSWNSKFVYYYWQYIYNSGVFFNFEGKTSGLKNLQFDNAIASIDIPEYTLEQQTEIADILSKLESKMTVNREINRNLEAMTRQLYDYWFVQFDFPNENGRLYKSSGGKMVWNEKLKRDIPDGWNVLSIGEILDKYPATKRFDTSEYLNDGLHPIIDQGESFIVGYTNETENVLQRHPAVLFGDHSTRVKYIDFPFGRGADGTQILYSKLKQISPWYLYLFISSLQIPNPGYSRHFKYLKEIPIIIPSQEIGDSFAQLVSPIFNDWTKNVFGNNQLMKQRDELLPLLMNGQVAVMPPEVNCDLSHD